MKNILLLLLFTAGGITLFATDYHTGARGFWAHVDTVIFHYFNAKLVPGSFFVKLPAVTNIRLFDVVAFLVMVCCGWLLLTPASDYASAKIASLLPRKLFSNTLEDNV